MRAMVRACAVLILVTAQVIAVVAEEGCPSPFFHTAIWEGSVQDSVSFFRHAWGRQEPKFLIAEVEIGSPSGCNSAPCVDIRVLKVFAGSSDVTKGSVAEFNIYQGDPSWKPGSRFVGFFAPAIVGARFNLVAAMATGQSTDHCIEKALKTKGTGG